MATKIDHLQALGYVCRDFGGRLTIVPQREFDQLFGRSGTDATRGDEELSESPFTEAHGLWWSRKIIYAVEGREEIGSIIHEMGHVFAAPHHPHHECSECHEWNWLGWEIVVARRVGAARTWSRHNAHYQTGEGGGGRWSTLTAKQRGVVVADRLAHAQKIGVVGTDGAPRSIR